MLKGTATEITPASPTVKVQIPEKLRTNIKVSSDVKTITTSIAYRS